MILKHSLLASDKALQTLFKSKAEGFGELMYLSHCWDLADQTWHELGPTQEVSRPTMKFGPGLKMASPEAENMKNPALLKWL